MTFREEDGLYLSVKECMAVTNATAPFGIEECLLTAVSIDSRKVEQGHVFFGLPGTKVHGQVYALKAFALGAGVVFAEELSACGDVQGRKNLLIVESAEKALAQCAAAVREKAQDRCKFIGITGSNGKTTTKETIAAVLSGFCDEIHFSRGNFNNHLGLPVSLLSLKKNATIAVFEMGMSHVGEIDFLGNILRPHIGIITNIGEAHIENLGSLEGIARAKGELISHIQPGGLLILNGNCQWAELLASLNTQGGTLYAGFSDKTSGEKMTVEFLEKSVGFDSVTGDVTVFWNDSSAQLENVEVPAYGRHLVAPYLFAIITALELKLITPEDLDVQAVVEKLFVPVHVGGRMETINKDGVCYINDGYNANPDSVKAAIRYLAHLPGNRKVVLGEMLEIGEGSPQSHREVAELSTDLLGKESVFLLGSVFEASASATGALYAPDVDSMIVLLKNSIVSGDTVLFKASRGVAIERVAQGLGVFNKI